MVNSYPQWFKEALSVNKEQRSIEVEGAIISYQKWGDSAKPGIVLVHGSGSHSHWWDFIAPLLLEDFQISFFFLMIRRPPRSTRVRSSAASDVYKRQYVRT